MGPANVKVIHAHEFVRAEGQLGAADLWFLADRLAKHRPAFSGKIAVLCPMERFDPARFFALLADSKLEASHSQGDHDEE